MQFFSLALLTSSCLASAGVHCSICSSGQLQKGEKQRGYIRLLHRQGVPLRFQAISSSEHFDTGLSMFSSRMHFLTVKGTLEIALQFDIGTRNPVPAEVLH